jgi:predicted DNA-binding protein (MmcQ/YjbR family)
MNIESLREYCISKKGVEECFPFNEDTLVFKLLGKMFLMTDLVDDLWICIKCDPEKAIELREQYPFVMPGYHMNKKHWNTIKIDEQISDQLYFGWIDESYELVKKSLSKKLQSELDNEK